MHYWAPVEFAVYEVRDCNQLTLAVNSRRRKNPLASQVCTSLLVEIDPYINGTSIGGCPRTEVVARAPRYTR